MAYIQGKGSFAWVGPVEPPPQGLTYHNNAFLTGEGGDVLTLRGLSRPVVGKIDADELMLLAA